MDEIDDEFALSPLSNAVLQNAERVLCDARALFGMGSYATAGALACVSIEEAGKACLVLWKDKGLLERDIARDVRDHSAKHRIVAALREAHAFVPLLRDRIADDELYERIERDVVEPNQETSILAKLGAYDAFKQYGLYVDIEEQVHYQPERVILPGDVEHLLAEATLALHLVRAIPFVHMVACGMYEAAEKPKRNPAAIRELREMLASRLPQTGQR